MPTEPRFPLGAISSQALTIEHVSESAASCNLVPDHSRAAPAATTATTTDLITRITGTRDYIQSVPSLESTTVMTTAGLPLIMVLARLPGALPVTVTPPSKSLIKHPDVIPMTAELLVSVFRYLLAAMVDPWIHTVLPIQTRSIVPMPPSVTVPEHPYPRGSGRRQIRVPTISRQDRANVICQRT